MTRTFYLVRHGKTVSNMQGVYPSDDTPLTEEGIAQAGIAAPWFANHKFDGVFVSPLIRARDTALLLGVQGVTVPALRDHNMGVYTGRPAGSYKLYCDAWNIPVQEFVPEGGESYDQARERVTSWLKTVGEGTYLIVAHTDTLYWIVEETAGACPPHQFQNVSLWVVKGTELVHTNWKPWLE